MDPRLRDRVILLILMLMFLSVSIVCLTGGCAHIQEMPSVCDTISPDDSVLCRIATSHGVRLETIGDSLRFANALAIGFHQYTAEDAVEVAKKLKDIINTPNVTTFIFESALKDFREQFPGMIEAVAPYLIGTGLDIPFAPWDIDHMNSWFDETIVILGG